MKLGYVLLIVLAVAIGAGLIWRTRSQSARNIPEEVATPLADSPDKTAGTIDTLSSPKIQPLNRLVRVTLKTSSGNIDLELDGKVAPLTVGNFVQLATQNFYDGTSFHRVIPEFMIQGGDPLSRNQELRSRHGTGGPGYTFSDEFNDRKLVRGSVAMANSGPNTNGSQFFIVTGESFPHLDGKHTNFGTVTKGMEVVGAISAVERDANDNPLQPIVIKDVIVHDLPDN